MKYQIYILRKKSFNVGIITTADKNDNLEGWELIGEARTKREAQDIRNSIENLLEF